MRLVIPGTDERRRAAVPVQELLILLFSEVWGSSTLNLAPRRISCGSRAQLELAPHHWWRANQFNLTLRIVVVSDANKNRNGICQVTGAQPLADSAQFETNTAVTRFGHRRKRVGGHRSNSRVGCLSSFSHVAAGYMLARPVSP